MLTKWQKQKQAIIGQHGEWYSYGLNQEGKTFFVSDLEPNGDKTTLDFFGKIITCAQDFLKKPLAKATVLDLACGEGLATFAFADYGVKSVLGIDGRQANIAKAKFAAQSLNFRHLKFKTGDVRNIATKKKFDVVLTLGIAYHLDVPDLFNFMEKLYEVSRGCVIIDTHVALIPKIKKDFKGHDYFGLYYQEFPNNATNETAVGNAQSFWLTQASLTNLLTRVGFTGIYEFRTYPGKKWRGLDDRLIIIATKLPRRKLKHFPNSPVTFFPERDPWLVSANNVNVDAMAEIQPFRK